MQHKDDYISDVSSVDDYIDPSMYTTPQSLAQTSIRHPMLRWARLFFLSLRRQFLRRRSQPQSQPQRQAVPLPPRQPITIYYHPVIPPRYPRTTEPLTPVIPGTWQDRQYHAPPPAYHYHAPAPTPAPIPTPYSRPRSYSRSQGVPYNQAYNHTYNHTQITHHHLIVPPTHGYLVPPPGAYAIHTGPHPPPVAQHTTLAPYPYHTPSQAYPGPQWGQPMLAPLPAPQPVRPVPYITPTPYPLSGPPVQQRRAITRSESPDQPPHPSWLGPNGELPLRARTPPRYRNPPRRAPSPAREPTPPPSPPRRHRDIPRSVPIPAPTPSPLPLLSLLQTPSLSGPPQSILSDLSIPPAPGHRHIERYEVASRADREEGSGSQPSRGRRKSRSRKAKEGGS